MTLFELGGLVKNLTGEDVTDENDSAALFTPAQLAQAVDLANQSVWRGVVEIAPSWFTRRSADITYDPVAQPNGLPYNDGSVDPDGIYLLTDIEVKYLDRYFALKPFRPVDRHLFEPTWIAPALTRAYYVEAEKIVLTPPPGVAQILRLSYVPQAATLAAPTDVALNGLLPAFHPLVGYEAALFMLGKDESRSGTRDYVERMVKQLRMEMHMHVTRRSAQDGRRVRHMGFERD